MSNSTVIVFNPPPPIPLELPAAVHRLLYELTESGFYGANIGETARMLFLEKCRQIQADAALPDVIRRSFLQS